MTPSLTIGVCIRNGEVYVDRCFEALLREAVAHNFLVVAVNHLSTDRTGRKLEMWQRRFPEVLTVYFCGDHGLARARDFAWRQSRTPWVGFVDVDCEVRPGWGQAVTQNLPWYSTQRQCGAFGGTNLVPDNGQILYRAYSLLLCSYVGGHSSILNRPVHERKEVKHTPTLNVVYRREALAAIGGFDPVFTRVGEDLDLSYRLTRAGYSLWTCPKMVVEHALRPSLVSWLKNMFLYGRGRCFFIKRHPGSFEMKFMVPGLIAVLYGLCLLAVVSGRLPVFTPLWLATAHVGGAALGLLQEKFRQGARGKSYALAILMVWLTHLTYGFGMLRELFSDRKKFA